MFFDIIYHNFMQNTVKMVLLNITEIELSHRSEFFSGRFRSSPEKTVLETVK